MELEELQEDIQIVFDKEESDQEEGSTFYFNCTYSNSESAFKYPNSEALIEIFSIIKNENKLLFFFINYLKKTIIESEENQYLNPKTKFFSFVSMSPICFYVLMKLGYVAEAIDSFKKRREPSRKIHLLLLQMVDWGYFSNSQLREVLAIIGDPINDIEESLVSKIKNARFQLLKRNMKNVNAEINQDERTVIEKIRTLKLNPNYSELLTCIDNYLLTDTPEQLNAGMINDLRTFMADLTKEIANRIAETEHEKIPKIKESEMGNVRDYLKSKLDLTDKDNNLLDAFIDILHSKGGHSFTSEKEYFRLSRNIAIELALFILSKYEKKYKEN